METSSNSAPASRWRVVRAVLVYGVTGGVLISVLRLTEYRYLVVEHSVEIYGGLIATLFAGVGIWLGVTLTRKKPEVVVRQVPVEVRVPVPVEVRVEVPVPARPDAPFAVDAAAVERLAITPRELEILGLMAAGLSNREIAQRLFVSENTIKTHSSRVFDKLGARRRTQAVQIGQELGLLPSVAAASGRPKG
ncbi:MAG: response regulator transcription factor [Thermoanaerobaculia bacterium]